MFEFIITRPMGYIIEFIYNLVQNYGIAIILFTFLIKLALSPLNIKSQKSMKKQQQLQPILAELQKKYANDQEKLSRETMKLYKDNNVSMAGGCLPLLIQMPILVGLYQVIQRPLSYLLHVDFNAPEVITRVYNLRDTFGAATKLAEQTEENLARSYQMTVSQWSEQAGQTDWSINFNMFGLNLAGTPSEAMTYINELLNGNTAHLGTVLLLIIPIFAIIASIGTMLVQKMLTKNPSADAKSDSAQNSAAQMSNTMMWMMPVMTGFFTFTLPAGIGLYWIVSSVTQIIQQVVLNIYFDKKKGEELVVKLPEQKQIHSKKRKKHK